MEEEKKTREDIEEISEEAAKTFIDEAVSDEDSPKNRLKAIGPAALGILLLVVIVYGVTSYFSKPVEKKPKKSPMLALSAPPKLSHKPPKEVKKPKEETLKKAAVVREKKETPAFSLKPVKAVQKTVSVDASKIAKKVESQVEKKVEKKAEEIVNQRVSEALDQLRKEIKREVSKALSSSQETLKKLVDLQETVISLQKDLTKSKVNSEALKNLSYQIADLKDSLKQTQSKVEELYSASEKSAADQGNDSIIISNGSVLYKNVVYHVGDTIKLFGKTYKISAISKDKITVIDSNGDAWELGNN